MTKPGLRRRLRFLCYGLGAATAALAVLIARQPELAETLHGRFLSSMAASLSRATAPVPIALAEILLGLFVLRQVGRFVWGLIRVRGKKTRLGSFALDAGAGILAEASVILACFYLFWGFNYFRPKVEGRLGWSNETADLRELEEFSRELVQQANTAYLVLHGTDDVGRPTSASRSLLELVPFLDDGYLRVHSSLGEPVGVQRDFGSPKPLWLSPVLHYLGLSGFYFPWTGEACINDGVPPWQRPLVVAHEMAHQRGFAPEDEANFIGYLACHLAPDPLVRYAAALFAQSQILDVLYRTDRELWDETARNRLPGVVRDLKAGSDYWNRFQKDGSELTRKVHTFAREAAETVNDAYLRSQSVEGGIASYSRCAQLLIAYRRESSRRSSQERSPSPRGPSARPESP